ncbi:helix-turn-helix transcriptional regulator [Streptomyces sp. NPDC052225]|uniref:helix-turn-helix domain-containing protein n=1 Tax=Streptomyces sp. NPDC052225 TaxID=3154949 RepID=UPI00341F90B3
MTEQRRGRRAIEVGPTGKNVAENVARLRERASLTTRQLAAKLEQAGRPIPASGITRMENKQRVVTADELTALAAVFGVSPSALLLPLKDSATEAVEVTGAGAVPSDIAWAWASNKRPLQIAPGQEQTAAMEYALASLPPNLREAMQHPAGRALEAAHEDVMKAIVRSKWSVEGDEHGFEDALHQARTSLERTEAELGRLAVEHEQLVRFRDGGRDAVEGGD